ncbi:uncharacterized protein LOC101852831 [Aplysia californica]|uniref:Uncharacterized protein LOC101852831 n=1 Tax=Aplysia californica TaxID=6500 RepID=A0ABM0ZUM6_APLCA|nr:uncharacterized protein LOC101852831 [Aplysia californica]
MTFEPSPPPSVKVVNMTGSGVHLEWLESPTPPCCPVYGYSVKIRNLNDSSTFDVVTGRTNTKLDNLDPETLYGVKVTTFVRSGASKPSEEVFFTTPPAAPPKVTLGASSHVTLGGDANMTCQARSNDKTTFTWYLRAGASKVKVSQHYITELEFAQKYVVTSRETGPGLVTSSLLLQKVTTQEDVTFECEARNSAGADSRLLPMVVYGKVANILSV